MKVVVIGGGFVGQLVQLAIPDAVILDWRKVAPADHLGTRVGPQYLWEPIPGVPSREFNVRTTVDGCLATPDSIRAYKKKIGKEHDGGNWGLQFRPLTVGFHSQLPLPTIRFGCRVTDVVERKVVVNGQEEVPFDWLISTIPLPALLNILGSHHASEFRSDPIYMLRRLRKPQMFDSDLWLDYNSNPYDPVYRQTWTGGESFSESLSSVEGAFRIVPGKIHPHQGSETMVDSLRALRCQCFGRFGTWRPDELAHETWKHIQYWKESI